MPGYFSDSENSIDLILLTKNAAEPWLSQQSPSVKNWAKSCGFPAGQKVLLRPDAEGALQGAAAVIDPDGDYFVAGDLANQLPAGNYTPVLSELGLKDETRFTEQFATSWGLSRYRFDRYVKKSDQTPKATLHIRNDSIRERAQTTIDAVCLTRDLINTPASDMMPENLAAAVQSMAEEFGAQFSQIIGEELLSSNYPMIHSVGRASVHVPRLLDLRWGDETAPRVTLVGKGVCFDSGGLNIKPGNFMRQMKKDMGGAAHVIGLARLIMSRNLPIRLRVLVPAVENAVAGNAFRPGDVLPTRQGLTVEIDNTDAEGRLVLCDALTEASNDSPELIVDFATLTGACRVALGTELPGFFCNDETLAQELNRASARAQDPVWQLPLHAAYNDMLKSDIADTLNSSASGFGGAITAALYLQKFVGENLPWVHFDVMAWNNRSLPGRPGGGEAMGLRAVFEYLQSKYG